MPLNLLERHVPEKLQRSIDLPRERGAERRRAIGSRGTRKPQGLGGEALEHAADAGLAHAPETHLALLDRRSGGLGDIGRDPERPSQARSPGEGRHNSLRQRLLGTQERLPPADRGCTGISLAQPVGETRRAPGPDQSRGFRVERLLRGRPPFGALQSP
jgi:hypothetical protein